MEAWLERVRGGGFRRAAAVVVLLAALLPPARPCAAQGALSALQTEVDQLVRNAQPSVVTVFAQRSETARNPLPGQPTRRLHTRVGSGVAVEDNGILTTASVVLGAERVLVRTQNGLQVEAQVAGMDPIFNLALLRVPELRLPILRFAERPAQVGDWVVALGTSYRAQPTQSVGNIAYHYREPRTSLFQITNPVYPGNSGGAALNPRGELVGIVQGELGSPEPGSSGPDAERRPSGMSFVLPVETVKPVYESLRREGRVRHGYLGVSTRLASVESDSERGLRVPLGALVESVVAGSPADRTGLERGDLIVAFDRERVEYPEQLARWVVESRPGSAVQLVWARKGLERTGRVLLGESPSPLPEWAMAAPAATPAPGHDAAKIAELERQIRLLSRELERLKNPPDTP
ncbi:MAG: serine protease [Candidatus Eisenbacteria bacterium]|nr:serine protease [Candidatus Eisenbacteria bacterium]